MKRQNEKAVVLENVTVRRSKRDILKDITWGVTAGTNCAVIGANGAGKSTLIAVISGYMWPMQGSVSVLGNHYGNVEISRVRKRIGIVAPSRVPEIPRWMSLRKVVSSGLFGSLIVPPRISISEEDETRVEEKLGIVGLSDSRDKRMDEISTGERMRVLLARAMVAKHDLLLLDEPTAGLDLGARVAVVKALESMHRGEYPPTMIIVSHHLDELPAPLDGVLMLKQGEIVSRGPAAEVLTDDNLSRTFDCRVEVTKDNGHYSARVRREEWDL